MVPVGKSDFVLLYAVIRKLENNTYYRVFAKSLARTTCSAEALPPDHELVREMFHYFIREDELQIHYDGSAVSLDFIESEIYRRAVGKAGPGADLENEMEVERKLVWENEVYIKVQDLKKLYANKCIVFPKSLLTGCDTPQT